MTSAVQNESCPQATCLMRAGLQSQILLPSDSGYNTCEESYFSNTAKLRPACIIRPTSNSQVSTALRALVAANEKFAIRSGGHAPLAGSNNIHGGVTIDLSLLNSVRFDSASETVSFGPGVRWKHVYAEVQKYGRVVAGGREGETGVAGLLLGGGNTWMTARKGFACDNVVAFEVVLADGLIVTADRNTHADLFRALKGGSNNFGIVVGFTMSTIPCERVWGGSTASPKECIPDAIRITAYLTERVAENPDSSIITVISHISLVKDIVVGAALVETRGVENAVAFAEWSKLPKIIDTTGIKSMLELGLDTALPNDHYNTWFTLTVKNDERIMSKAAEVHDRLVEELKSYIPDGSFTTQCIFQPLPLVFARHSIAAGGNVLGLERNTSDGILLQMNTMVKTLDQKEFAYPRVKACIRAVEEYAATIDGGLLEWLYLNYADESQDVLRSYGAQNLEFMRAVSRKYDPQQVFQYFCPGGFKLVDVMP
ncbi:hypothetical protein DL767_000158 [Monosporascus sp. MG133]|nr:hypothetical protein DL767_000158 [Monosporascus sp. MG133]